MILFQIQMGGSRTFLLFIWITLLFADNGEQVTRREALQNIIGGGGGAPSSVPPKNQDFALHSHHHHQNQNQNQSHHQKSHHEQNNKSQHHQNAKSHHHQNQSRRHHHHHHHHHHHQHHHHHHHHHNHHHQKSHHNHGNKSLHHQNGTHRPPTLSVSPRLALVYLVIQAFKMKVKYDPLGNTKTWSGKKICEVYTGFVCDKVPVFNRIAIVGVNFNNFYLGGPNLTITDFLTGLPDIVFFHANSNNFTGSIPTDLNKLRYLKELDLSNNNFSDDFPYQLLRAKNLTFLDLRFNNFTGKIPPEVFLLNLNYLFINNNNFIQKLPDNLGSTPVHYLTLANNRFIGGIPQSIGQANNTLYEVLFLNNQLSGCLPYQIGFLKKATVFDVESNNFTGPIPHSFQCLKKIKALNLARNKFYGEVPDALCSLPELLNFTLSYNYFTKVGPQCRELILNGVLDMKMNCILDLQDQRSLADCASFFMAPRDSCANETSLTYVPACSGVYSDHLQLVSPGIQFTAPAKANSPVQAVSYGTLFRDYVIKTRLYT